MSYLFSKWFYINMSSLPEIKKKVFELESFKLKIKIFYMFNNKDS